MNEREIFLSALEIEDPVARFEHLKSACADDEELLTRVEALLASHESQSQFLNTPVVEQIADDVTLPPGIDSTKDEDPDADDFSLNEAETMIKNQDSTDDEIPLGYLEPSTKPDSLGRLAHYEILEVIGRGAFGIVLKAFDEKLQRVVAIKVLAPEMAATSPARKRFLREARASAAIRHENVVAIYAVDEQPTPFLVMEYIPGKTLQQRLDGAGPLDVKEVLRLSKQIAEGLAAAHAQDLIHRDIKPGNILLDESVNEHVKITDFGLARTADDASMTQSGVIAGTPMYMAPEQALGNKLDQRADLFSLGSVLYQMVSGRPPFRERSTVAVLRRVAEDTPRPIKEIIPETPDWLCELIGHLHAKDPADRYVSAEKVADVLGKSLEAVEAGQTPQNLLPAKFTSDEPTTPKPPVRKPSRLTSSRLAQAAMIGLVCLVCLGITEATNVTNLSSTVIRLVTGSGILVIETDDPNIIVAIDGEEISIKGAGVEELTLRPGEYKIAAMKDGQPIKQELVSITRNGRSVVRMSLESVPSDLLEAQLVVADSSGENWALEFDGIDDYGVIDGLRLDNLKNFTIEATVYVLEQEQPNGTAFVGFSDHTVALNINRGANNWDVCFNHGAKSDVLSYGQAVSRKGVHLAIVTDGSELRFYVNGAITELTTSVEWPFNTSIPHDHFLIATAMSHKNPANLFHQFHGIIDELRISKVARYTKDFTPQKRFKVDEHTLALYHFDEGTGNVLKDSSGNGHHGKIVGAKWVKASTRIDSTNLVETYYAAERKAAEWVLSIGGKVTCRVGEKSINVKEATDLPSTHFDILTVDLSDSSDFTAQELAQLRQFEIENFECSSPTFDDECMAEVGQIRSLKGLKLSGTQVSDEGMVHLRGIYALSQLSLSGTPITDHGLEIIVQNINNKGYFYYLYLHGTKVTNKGLRHLKWLTGLLDVRLDQTRITDDGLRYFADVPSLRTIGLVGVGVSDVGLAELKTLPKLAELHLQGTLVTDHGLIQLQDTPKLALIIADSTRVTDAGITEFHKTKPDCAVDNGHAKGLAIRDEDRFIAEWVLRLGGTLRVVRSDESVIGVINQESLPDTKIRVISIDLNNNSEVQDFDLQLIANLPNLQDLSLDETSISDIGMAYLTELKDLKKLHVSKTNVTKDGLINIRKTFPNCEVSDEAMPEVPTTSGK